MEVEKLTDEQALSLLTNPVVKHYQYAHLGRKYPQANNREKLDQRFQALRLEGSVRIGTKNRFLILFPWLPDV